MRSSVMTFSRCLVLLLAGIPLITLSGCHVPQIGEQRLLYIDAYHPGEPSSDETLAGLYEVVAESRAGLDVFFLDTKRYPQAEALAARVEEALGAIHDTSPEVIIVSGDTAVDAVVAGHLADGPIPCVFCAVDWNCEPYGLPTENVTGILRIPPVAETMAILRPSYPSLKRIAVLSGEMTPPHDNEEVLNAIFAECQLTPTYASAETYEEWKLQFARVAGDVDVILLLANQGIAGWDEADAQAFVRDYARLPVVTCDVSMTKYAMFGLCAADREQGRRAAKTALRILRGKRPARIPIARSQETEAYINVTFAENVGFEPDDELLSRCHHIE